MTDTVGKFTSLEDDVDRLRPRMEAKATGDQGVEALKDIAFGSVNQVRSFASHEEHG